MGNWGCNPYKYPINGDITITITLLITGRGPSCREQSVAPLPSCPCQLPHAKRRHADLPQCQQSAIQQQHRDAPAIAMFDIWHAFFGGRNFGNHNEKMQLSFQHVVKSAARMCARWRDVTFVEIPLGTSELAMEMETTCSKGQGLVKSSLSSSISSQNPGPVQQPSAMDSVPFLSYYQVKLFPGNREGPKSTRTCGVHS